jgi:hypothetical protein
MTIIVVKPRMPALSSTQQPTTRVICDLRAKRGHDAENCRIVLAPSLVLEIASAIEVAFADTYTGKIAVNRPLALAILRIIGTVTSHTARIIGQTGAKLGIGRNCPHI